MLRCIRKIFGEGDAPVEYQSHRWHFSDGPVQVAVGHSDGVLFSALDITLSQKF
jgi:hypothetical protein